MIDVREIADRFNALAPSLAPELLPNGHKAGSKWMFSGIDDTGKSASAWVNLSGAAIGHWTDMGSSRAGEDKGDMLDLLALKRFGGDLKAAIHEAKRRLGIVDAFDPGYRPDPAEIARRAAEARARALQREAEEAAEREKKARGARALWLSGVPIAGTPAEAYLRARDLAPDADGEWPGSFRFHASVPCGPLGRGVKVPALLCSIVSPAGVQIGTHRIFIERERGLWSKRRDIPKAKMVLGNMWGGFIPIDKGASRKSMRDMPEGEPVYGSEGPEKALCVRMLKPGARNICAINLPNLGAIVLPAQAKRLVWVADRPGSDEERASLERAIAAQQARGVSLGLVFPPAPHKDIDEWYRAWLREQRGQRRRA
jgi:hypothetical protein